MATKQMTTKEMIEVIQAWDEGKHLEVRVLGYDDGEWVPASNPTWDFHYCEYRIKLTREDEINEIKSQFIKMCSEQYCDACKYNPKNCNVAFVYDYMKGGAE